MLVAWGGDWTGKKVEHWSYDALGEDHLERTNPYRVFPSVDSGVRFGRPDLSGRRTDNASKTVNRCQKPVELFRSV